MKTIKAGLLMVALAILSLNLSGCGTGSDQPELGLVTGTVTLDDKPLKGIEVVFHPENGRPARGKTDSDGRYELTYIYKTFGTKLGHNRVEIAPNEEGEDEDSEGDGGGEQDGAAKKRSKPGKIKIPARYNSKSELKANVEVGENVFDFNLESKVSE